ncbi:MAG TPA: isopentenyl-diphosphate Delta-isomerase [Candidatus Peribacteria bacterium]|nr:isopentenyl-diphosphate Delta-isomerase [Candidatus Peribacteria bacterium]
MDRTVTLVDEEGTPLGEADLLEAHTGKGKLHLAFSVYVFRNGRKEILIQRRSDKKMLWAGVWANTACSHPFPDESPAEAGERRLKEEMGFTTPLVAHSDYVYRAECPNGKGVEHEYVTMLVGYCPDADVQPNPDEVSDWKWMSTDKLLKDFESNPEQYTPWFHLGLPKLLK